LITHRTEPTFATPDDSGPRVVGRRSASSLLVPRPRLLEGLVVQPAAVSLICAPAGSGKTSLIRGLIEASGDVPTGYVDTSQTDPTVQGLWTAILASLSSLDVFSASSRIHELRPPVGAVAAEFVDNLVAAIAATGHAVRLVVDDLHVIDDPETFRSLDLLLSRQPGELLLVLSTRHDLPLALHRHRLAGCLHEIRGTDLAFHVDEIGELLARAGCDLATAGVELLHRHTEGWAAGIRIAVLSLLTGADPEELLTDFGGHDQAVADYLMAEVLAQQSEEMRTFLLTTSACSTLPAELAVQLSGREDAAEVLDDLVRRHALTEQIDRRRRIYRYHIVLRTYLDAERRRRRPGSEAQLQRTAGEWFAVQGEWLHALEHLVRADDPELLMTLVRERSVTIMFDGQLERLERVFELLPAELLQEPSVCLLRALLATPNGRTGFVKEMLAHLDLSELTAVNDHLVATLATLVRVQRCLPGEDLEPVLGELVDLAVMPTGNADVDLLVRHHWGLALIGLSRPEEGNDVLLDVIDRARLGGRDALAISCLGQMATSALMVEELAKAEALALEARSTAAHRGWMQVPHLVPAQVALVWISFQRADRDAARRYLDEALDSLSPDTDPRLTRAVEACAAVIRLDGGHNPYQVLRDHRSLSHSTPVEMSPQFYANFGPLLVWNALLLGEQAWAVEFARDYSDYDVAPGEHDLMRAMLLHAAGHDVAASKTLGQIIDGAVGVLLRSTLIHAHLLSSAVARQRAIGSRAHESLVAALRLADETGILRPFLNVGPEVHRQLIVSADRSGHLASVAHDIVGLLNGGPTKTSPLSRLTPAEVNILRDLPSLLTIRDIAESRSVSTNTVKTHLSAIYRKLGVNARREAVEVARKRGLL
jgi:LuxR family transcriptional regulator, maltose regulon positive regulatory protein